MSSNIIKNPLSKNEFLHEITIDDLDFDKNYGTYLKLKVNSDPILFASLQMMLKDKKITKFIHVYIIMKKYSI